MKRKSKWKRITLWSSISLAFLICIAVAALIFSPKPFVYWLRAQPDNASKPPANYVSYQKQVNIKKDITYTSKYNSHTYDLYTPKDMNKKYPTIIWVHGGAFVAGDKKGTTDWATMMASKGYNIYEL